MPDFGIMRGFNEKLFGDKLVAGQLPTQLGLIGSQQVIDFVGLLDYYPNAAAAYSVRKLRAAYTGSSIRVRRSSDNTEQDIGFSNGDLDTSALTSFCGSGDGFVTTWYDQSGNGYNVIQSIAANQPQIVSSGVVLTENSKPCVNFTSTDKKLLSFNNSLAFNDCTISYVCRYISNASFASGGFGYGNNLDFNKTRYLMPLNNFLSFVNFAADYTSTINASNDSTINLYSANYVMSTNVATVFRNATSQSGSPTNAAMTTTTGKFAINEIADRNENSTINFSEGVFYATNNNSNLNGIRSNQNTYYAIY